MWPLKNKTHDIEQFWCPWCKQPWRKGEPHMWMGIEGLTARGWGLGSKKATWEGHGVCA